MQSYADVIDEVKEIARHDCGHPGPVIVDSFGPGEHLAESLREDGFWVVTAPEAITVSRGEDGEYSVGLHEM